MNSRIIETVERERERERESCNLNNTIKIYREKGNINLFSILADTG